MEYFVAAKTLTGKVRRNNEDTFCIDGETLPLLHGDSALISKELLFSLPHLVGVFDGMGGYSNGEKASYLAASIARIYWNRIGLQQNPAEVLTELCLEANDTVCGAASGTQMGTTCAMLCLNGDGYTLCNIGDSPIFLVRDGVMEQLSIDHNQRAMYEKITGKPAKPGQKFRLTQCIGIPREEMLIEPFTAAGRLQPGDTFLLCSDGITDMLRPEAIAEILGSSKTAEEAVTRLTERALENGGKDNITAVCVNVSADCRKEKRSSIVAKIFRGIPLLLGKRKIYK